jgi:hypothetical protein
MGEWPVLPAEQQRRLDAWVALLDRPDLAPLEDVQAALRLPPDQLLPVPPSDEPVATPVGLRGAYARRAARSVGP